MSVFLTHYKKQFEKSDLLKRHFKIFLVCYCTVYSYDFVDIFTLTCLFLSRKNKVYRGFLICTVLRLMVSEKSIKSAPSFYRDIFLPSIINVQLIFLYLPFPSTLRKRKSKTPYFLNPGRPASNQSINQYVGQDLRTMQITIK